MAAILKMENMVKRFGEIVANDHINFEVEGGEIHSLLGENGAGKTTLMNILYGLYEADEGKLYIRGREVKFNSPADAIKEDIGMVSQHFSLVPRLTVSENIVMGDIPTKRFFAIDSKMARERVLHLAGSCGFKINVDAKVEELAAGEQQRVEIIKAVYRGAQILILDEPTAVLTSQEVRELFKMLRSMTSQGRPVIFITHKLDEAMNCDRITVLRAGRVVFESDADSTTKEELVKAMFVGGVSYREYQKPSITKERPVVLEVENLHAMSSRRLSELKGISFNILAGEIVGVAGIAGNGQVELAEVITGLRKATQGRILLKGEDVTNCSPVTYKERKVAHITDSPTKTGSFGDLSIAENLIAGREHKPPFAHGFRLVYSAIKDFAKKMVSIFDVKTMSVDTLAKHLSGGNLQKLMLARELAWDPEIIVAACPTRGLDAKTTELVRQRLLEQREEGKAILLVSQDLSELLALSDRIGVMYEGRMTMVPQEEANTGRIERLMVGLQDEP